MCLKSTALQRLLVHGWINIMESVNKRREFWTCPRGNTYDITWENNNELLRHGGPWDRGAADSYYGRLPKPHYYVAGTGNSERIEQDAMTPAEIQAYRAGYDYNEEMGDRKDYG